MWLAHGCANGGNAACIGLLQVVGEGGAVRREERVLLGSKAMRRCAIECLGCACCLYRCCKRGL